MGCPSGSDGKENASNEGELGLITRLGRCLGGGHHHLVSKERGTERKEVLIIVKSLP